MDKIKKYKNGLTLIVSEGGSISTSFAIMVGTGSINETEKNNGISHYIEHMNFKGTQKYSSYDISNILDGSGANYNAYTSVECTCYYAQTIKEELEKTFSLMAEMTFSSVYESSEAEKEKGVIIEEINMSADTPDDVCYDLSARAYYGNDGYGRTVLGSIENVSSFTKQDVLDYLNDYYVAENTVISFAGNITLNEADLLVEKYIIPIIKTHKKATTPKHNISNMKGTLSENKDIEQVHFCLNFESMPFVNEKKINSEMAVAVLGGGMSSRLFIKVREELGLAYSVYSFASRYKDSGTVSVYAGVNAKKYLKAYEEVKNVLKELRNNGITEEEFLKVKNQLKASTVFGLERPQSKVQLFAKYYLLTGKLYNSEERLNDIDKVKISEVNDACLEFNTESVATAIVGRKVKPLK